MSLDGWAWLSLLWLAMGATCVITMVEILGQVRPQPAPGTKRLHRIAGWLFLVLYVLISIGMAARLDRFGPPQGLWIGLHVYLGVGLFVPLIAKVLVVRRYKKYMASLPALGAMILALALTLVGTSGLWRAGARVLGPTVPVVYGGRSGLASVPLGKKVAYLKCARCHDLVPVYLLVKPEAEWLRYVKRMQDKDPGFLTDEDCANAVAYLSSLGQR